MSHRAVFSGEACNAARSPEKIEKLEGKKIEELGMMLPLHTVKDKLPVQISEQV